MSVSLDKTDYVGHKFDSALAEKLYDWTMDSSEDASLGESETFGWYALFRDMRTILVVNSQGFVTAWRCDDIGATQTAWETIEAEYEAFECQRDDAYGECTCDYLKAQYDPSYRQCAFCRSLES